MPPSVSSPFITLFMFMVHIYHLSPTRFSFTIAGINTGKDKEIGRLTEIMSYITNFMYLHMMPLTSHQHSDVLFLPPSLHLNGTEIRNVEFYGI